MATDYSNDNPTTGSMQVYDGPENNALAKKSSSGFVLLYTSEYFLFPTAIPFFQNEIVIGRDPSCSFQIPDLAASRQHVRISKIQNQWILTDLSSRNGTIVDGRFIQEIVLEPFHEVRIGDSIFKFVEHFSDGYLQYRIDGSRMHQGELPNGEIIGGFQIHHLADSIDKVAATNISVILFGESGTGKEVFAKHLHKASGRKGAFQAINCAAIPPNLLESELFGYKKGAFTGAERDKTGLVQSANGGTLFLDEIGDMPLEAQAKLLRVLQAKEVFPIGSITAEKVDVRVVCATHRKLSQLLLENKFRGDLYARLNEYNMTLPPLRERKEDIFALSQAFLKRYGYSNYKMGFGFMLGLLHYDFPFNVRELEAIIKRGSALTQDGLLEAIHLPDEIKEMMKTYGQQPPKRKVSSPYLVSPISEPFVGRTSVPTEETLRSSLRRHQGNIAAVSREFGKERMQIHRWMKKYLIQPEEYR